MGVHRPAVKLRKEYKSYCNETDYFHLYKIANGAQNSNIFNAKHLLSQRKALGVKSVLACVILILTSAGYAIHLNHCNDKH